METNLSRQGLLAGWMKEQGVTVRQVADHCNRSAARMSFALKAETVPTKIHDKLRSFKTETGRHIPVDLLPEAKDQKPGPKKGWLDDRRPKAATPDAA